MIALPPSIVVVEKPCAVDHHAHDAESGSDSNADYDCFVPLDAAEDHVDAEMGAQVNASALLADEHNPSLQQGQDESAPASEPPATHAATDFVKYDPCGNWGEHLRLMYKGKGKEREPVGYALQGGMQAIPGEGDCWMHDKSGFKPNYSKEVKTGVKGREHSTSTSEGPGGNFLPKERKGVTAPTDDGDGGGSHTRASQPHAYDTCSPCMTWTWLYPLSIIKHKLILFTCTCTCTCTCMYIHVHVLCILYM